DWPLADAGFEHLAVSPVGGRRPGRAALKGHVQAGVVAAWACQAAPQPPGHRDADGVANKLPAHAPLAVLVHSRWKGPVRWKTLQALGVPDLRRDDHTVPAAHPDGGRGGDADTGAALQRRDG